MSHSKEIEPLLTREHVATLYNVTVKTLDNWRCLGKGPNFLKIGARVLYRKEDVVNYMNCRVFASTSEYNQRTKQ
jgi:helix-turn-helix protein